MILDEFGILRIIRAYNESLIKSWLDSVNTLYLL
jgi:hypothetical protein